MAVDDICVVRAVGRYQDQNVVNTMHYKIKAQVSAEIDILESLTLAWDMIIRSNWIGRHIDSYTLVGIKAFRVTGAAKVPHYRNMNHAGVVTGTEIPSNICRVITFYTASTNHRRRGRLMLSGCETAMFNVSDGAVTGAEQVLMQVLADQFETDLINAGDEFTPCIPPSGALGAEVITKAVARVTPGAISSRRIRRYLVG